jgi:hypothetical protein
VSCRAERKSTGSAPSPGDLAESSLSFALPCLGLLIVRLLSTVACRRLGSLHLGRQAARR